MKTIVLTTDNFIKPSHTGARFRDITVSYETTGILQTIVMQAHSPHPHINDMIMALIGLETLAYIRPRTGKDIGSFAVCAADGTELAVFDSAESAYFTARQNNLQPVSIH